MYRNFFFVGLLWITMSAKAHQANVSTTMLVERENNTWVLQISTSLTAFQQEIRTHFSETPYKTPEEFQQMVLEHMKNNLNLSFNGNEDISFGKGFVKLGHDTKVVFEVFGIPLEIKSVLFQNTAFKDIHRNQSALILMKEGFSKEHFVLNNANNHTLKLYVDGNTFKALKSNESNNSASYLGWFLGGGAFLVVALMTIAIMFKPEKIVLSPME
ncbi:MAG: hypothetical protein WBG48_07025 [Pricia sp.]